MLGVIYKCFCSFLKVLDVIKRIIEAIICFLGVIEVFLVLIFLFVGVFKNVLHIINLILYMIYLSPEEINAFYSGVNLECLFIKRMDEIMSTESPERRAEL